MEGQETLLYPWTFLVVFGHITRSLLLARQKRYQANAIEKARCCKDFCLKKPTDLVLAEIHKGFGRQAWTVYVLEPSWIARVDSISLIVVV